MHRDQLASTRCRVLMSGSGLPWTENQGFGRSGVWEDLSAESDSQQFADSGFRLTPCLRTCVSRDSDGNFESTRSLISNTRGERSCKARVRVCSADRGRPITGIVRIMNVVKHTLTHRRRKTALSSRTRNTTTPKSRSTWMGLPGTLARETSKRFRGPT